MSGQQYQAQTVFTGHNTKTINKRAGGTITLNVFTAADGREYQAWQADVANQALALIGQPVTVLFEQKINGNFTNYDLVSVAGVNGGMPTPSPVTQSEVTQAQATVLPAPEMPTPGLQGKARDIAIWRQSGLDRALTAFGIAGENPLEQLDKVIALTEKFIDYFENGSEAVLPKGGIPPQAGGEPTV